MLVSIEQILKAAVQGGASDILLKAGTTPKFRKDGILHALGGNLQVDTPTLQRWAQQLIPQHLEYHAGGLKDLDFTYQSSKGHRFRVNIFSQNQSPCIAMRLIASHIRSMEELQLPPALSNLTSRHRGLFLITGATGSGKSTTLAAIIDKINQTRACHIITIEDPIEYIFQDKKSMISQRELGLDIASYPEALRSSLRQSPDILMVGELRDRDTIETAIMAAETGHAVFSTLHTPDASQSLRRMLAYFPPEQHPSLQLSLSQCLEGVVSQRLVPRASQSGMVPAIEIMFRNNHISELISKGHFDQIHQSIQSNKSSYGMQSFDQSLLELYSQGIITEETALEASTNPKDFALHIKGVAS